LIGLFTGNGHAIHTDDVILRGSILGVKTDRVFLIVDELWIRPAELAVCSGVAIFQANCWPVTSI
jgi:hypothetical protein